MLCHIHSGEQLSSDSATLLVPREVIANEICVKRCSEELLGALVVGGSVTCACAEGKRFLQMFLQVFTIVRASSVFALTEAVITKTFSY